MKSAITTKSKRFLIVVFTRVWSFNHTVSWRLRRTKAWSFLKMTSPQSDVLQMDAIWYFSNRTPVSIYK